MRYFLAAIFICAICAPPASALPALSHNSVSLSKADSIVQVAKQKRAPAQRQSRGGSGGIHPLVGSGDY